VTRPSAWIPRRRVAIALLLAAATILGGCSASTPATRPTADDPVHGLPPATGLLFVAPGVSIDGALPRESGGTSMDGGRDVSPALSWSGPVPTGTRSWALAMVDTTPPGRGYAHWLVLDIPVSASSIPTGATGRDLMPRGSAELRNDAGGYGYSGPQPPAGTHSYEFVLYAMPTASTGLGIGASKDIFFQTVATALGQQTLRATYSTRKDGQ
jgi:Raf kinase inhibitor-like YbhB/YbcL family protein